SVPTGPSPALAMHPAWTVPATPGLLPPGRREMRCTFEEMNRDA
ncbi:MAG: hypothetical protein QOE66_826, partial [Chloroflexota bacterium]|nr:hypothetical protein [Chloroflexota bacterium]